MKKINLLYSFLRLTMTRKNPVLFPNKITPGKNILLLIFNPLNSENIYISVYFNNCSLVFVVLLIPY